VKAKPVVVRPAASDDIEAAISYYLEEDAPQAALDFVDALDKAYSHLGRNPGTGSPRYAHELDVPDLRFWKLSHFPYLVFYVEQPDHVDVWRVLHEVRDIPPLMQNF
jgi:toxin ParE1/3/4